MQRAVSVGLANVLTGNWVDFDLSSDFLTIMKGSFAYAGMFPPMEAMNSEWFAGSAIWDLDAITAVKQCVKAGYAVSDV
jgi:hypothetical protein